jgi:mRNA interferase MazF
VLVPFPYSDLSSSKRRPVLILSNNKYNNHFPDILVCVITSNLYKDDYSVILSDKDIEAGILPEKSVIKCHKLFTIEQSKIIKRFSIVHEAKFEEVRNMILQLIQTSV